MFSVPVPLVVTPPEKVLKPPRVTLPGPARVRAVVPETMPRTGGREGIGDTPAIRGPIIVRTRVTVPTGTRYRSPIKLGSRSSRDTEDDGAARRRERVRVASGQGSVVQGDV